MNYDATQAVGNILTVSGYMDSSKAETELRLPDGRVVRLPTALLVEQRGSASPLALEQDMVAFPIIEEELVVGKQVVPTGKVVLEKRVHEYKQALDVPLAVRTFDVERVVLNRPVETAPAAVRVEGETTVYSLVEEQLVLTKQLILKEELRVTKRDTERRDTREVTLRRESMDVTRTPLDRAGER